ncbi:hypothetical protein HOE91_03595 [archaeon]|jgi:hypothetical protein|nr:hypothetical protein [archaeon]
MVKEQPIGGSSSVDLKRLLSGYVDEGKRREIEKYLEDRRIRYFHEIKDNKFLADRFGVSNSARVQMGKELFRLGFLQEISIPWVIEWLDLGDSSVNPYLDPKIMGDRVEEYREQIWDSEEFLGYLCRKFGSLLDVKVTRKKLSQVVGFEGDTYDGLKKKLFELGFFTDIPIDETLTRLNDPFVNPYLNPKIVGDMVDVYRAVVVRSREFRKFLEQRFGSLYGVRADRGVNRLLGVRNVSSLRIELFKRGFFHEIPIQQVIEGLDQDTRLNPYLDSEVVGDRVEEYREHVLESDEFGEWVNREYGSLVEVVQRKALSTLLDVEYTTNPIRKKLFELGYLREPSILDLMAHFKHHPGTVNPYLDPEIVGEENVRIYSEQILESDEFEGWLYTKFSKLTDITTVRSFAVRRLLGIKEKKVGPVRKALVERGFYRDRDILRSVVEEYGNE